MAEAFIAGAVRTAIGKRNGSLAGVHPVDLGAHALRGLVDRTGIDPAAVDDVIMGCVSQIGPQTFDIARNAWLSAGSIPVRSTSPRRACAPRSTGWTPARDPFRLPIAVRTAPAMNASAITASVRRLPGPPVAPDPLSGFPLPNLTVHRLAARNRMP